MSVTSIVIDGTAVSLADVDYSISVYHGRDGVDQDPQPSHAELTLYITGDASIPVNVSDSIVIQSWSTNRFTGRVTDLTLEHAYSVDGTPIASLSIIAIGRLSLLGRYVSTAAFAAQTLQARVNAILTATGLTYTAEADPNIDLLAYDPGPTSVRDLLDELSEWTGATMYDTPDGRIWWESYTRRGYDYSTATWADMGTTAWSATLGAWSEQASPDTVAPTPVVLPASAVVWSPSWTTTASTIVNDATIAYGASVPQATVNLTDTASITTHGRAAVELETGLANSADATRRAQNILNAQAAERYQIGKVEVLLERLTSGQRASVLALKAGARVLVTDLPQPAPVDQFLGVVEGWGELHTPDRVSLTLALSDPRYSYAVISWSQAPATATWAGVPASKTWADIVLPADLAA